MNEEMIDKLDTILKTIKNTLEHPACHASEAYNLRLIRDLTKVFKGYLEDGEETENGWLEISPDDDVWRDYQGEFLVSNQDDCDDCDAFRGEKSLGMVHFPINLDLSQLLYWKPKK